MAVEVYEGISTLQIIRSVAISILAFIAIFGNGLVLFILPRVKSCKGNPRMFLTSLTIADMLCGVFVGLPMCISSVANEWIFGGDYCNFSAGARIGLNTAALLSLLAVTVDRYIAIAYPLRYHSLMTHRKSICVLAIIWSLGFVLPFFYGPMLKHTPAQYFSDHYLCYFTGSDPNEFDWSIICCLTVFVLTPFIITTTIYVKLFIILRRHDKFVVQFQVNKSSKTKNVNFLITFFLVIVYFAISWMPVVILRLIELLTDISAPKEVDMLMEVLILANNGINIFTYYFRDKNFKNAAMKTLYPARKKSGKNSTSSTDSSTSSSSSSRLTKNIETIYK